jgi:hypothetical protein
MLSFVGKTIAAAGLTVSVALTSGPTLADMPVTYKDEGRALFHLSVPDFWTARAGGGRALTAPGSEEARLINRVIGLTPVSEDGIWMGGISPHGVRTYDEALEYLRGVGPFLVNNAEVSERKRISIGGMPAARLTGSGSRDGKAVSFTAVVVDLPRDRVAISVVVMEAGVNPDLVSDVNAVFASFRAVR